MSTFPDPTRTPQGPAYEGRLLDRPDEEVVDQGAPFDLRTLFSRRTVLSLVGLGAGGAVLAACTPSTSSAASTATSTPAPTVTSTAPATTAAAVALPAAEIPDETAGPYPGDGSNGPDALADSGIVRQDIRSSIGAGTTAAGVPLTFSLNILDMASGDAPFAGVAVYAWHCNAAGGYSMYSSGIEKETYLRGVQVADADGRVSFTSIFPGCYSGRWPHIHFEVYPSAADVTDSANAIATSQIALPQSACDAVYATAGYDGSAQNLAQTSLTSDNVFGDDGGALQLAAVTGDTARGYSATLTVRVDTRTAPTGGSMGGGPR
ncbi:intradiol ring-cleavage dioxygenase [Microbacterium azadirachtae]|uniref:intradiol ring-cleavage dioxygenase n=1 Tax=Microbacterium azadirachtae TaxID=582680 RepID=UPI00088D4789|nr:intradiol ring-cleavage dioxygenase [Microbacterium azadirachtae]SDM06444.1 Protocatechuate 3,4-dioxygenase beta subunit [Microbacterium azadirachtae]SEG31651.1 Protocatechuate 3,4-dioxygenase beta subunit [Microbacterium azadirachtae]SEG34828.1 Protocatechuate 3,4-dioxygenase beta subunit [Microbacterium azadirachtae]